MLTKIDLSQIRKIVREEVEAESKTIRTDIEYEIRRSRVELALRLDKIERKVKDLDIRTSHLETNTTKMLKTIQKTLMQVKNDINSLGRYADENHIVLRKIVEQLEEQVRISHQ